MIEIPIQINLQSTIVKRKIINIGSINSALDRPNQIVLNAFPLDFVKYLEIVVEAVWDIMPCPENLIKKIATNKRDTEETWEKKKHEKDKSKITINANFDIFMSSIFFPTQIKIKLLNNVADAYIVPNCPWLIDNSFLILGLNIPRKKLCPKLEKNVNINPNINTFKLKFLNIINVL